MRRRRRSRKEWERIVEQWSSSGEPAQTFARRQGVGEGQLRTWRRVLTRARADAGRGREAVRLIELPMMGDAEQDRQPHAFELALGRGRRLSFSAGVDQQQLVAVIRAVEEA